MREIKKDWGVVDEKVAGMLDRMESTKVALLRAAEGETGPRALVDISENLQLVDLEKKVRRGRCVDLESLNFFSRATGGEGRRWTRYCADLLTAAEDHVLRGRRFNRVQLEALRSVCPDAAEQYDDIRETKIKMSSSAARVAALVSRRSDIGELPPVADPDRRERYRYDLLGFGVEYCGSLLKHEPSEEMEPFIRQLQETILHAGLVHVRWPRGKGKSTWIKIAMIWAVVYGHRRFPVVFGAVGAAAESIIDDVWRVLTESEELLADFPGVCYPIRCLAGIMQRCDGQTYRGQRTEIKKTTKMICFPKIPGSEASGAVIVARGADAGVRGIVKGSMRPDFVFFDDLQDRKTAGSASAVKKLELFVKGDALGLAGHDRRIAAFMASTPIMEGDLSERFADSNRHPEWVVYNQPLVLKWPKNMDLVADFGVEYRRDVANHDADFTLSRAFYLAHRAEIEDGAKVLDPLDGDPRLEYSAIHHALDLYFSSGKEVFEVEYQMKTRGSEDLVAISPELIMRKVNDYPVGVIPRECRRLVIYSDVNARAEIGIRWCAMAVGPGMVTSVVAYGRYPDHGQPLFPPRSTKTQRANAISLGVLAVADRVLRYPFRDADGRPVKPAVLCFDGGWETEVVSRTVARISAPKTKVIWSKGFGWKTYRAYSRRRGESSMEIGDHTHISVGGKNGEFLSYQADYWREIMQRAFLAQPLQRGSCSLYGSDPSLHYDFTAEVCAERLIAQGKTTQNEDTWEWMKTGENHYGDCLMGCYVVASHYRFYDAMSDAIELAVRTSGGAFTRRSLATNRERVVRRVRYNLQHGRA